MASFPITRSQSWTPSPARTVFVVPQQPLRGVTPSAVALQWPSKAAAETLDFTLDLTCWSTDDADSINEVTVGISGTGLLTINWLTIIGQKVVFLASGGTAGVTYLVSLTATTMGGRTGFWTVGLPVDTQAPSAAPVAPSYAPNAAVLPGNVIIQDPTGIQPLILA